MIHQQIFLESVYVPGPSVMIASHGNQPLHPHPPPHRTISTDASPVYPALHAQSVSNSRSVASCGFTEFAGHSARGPMHGTPPALAFDARYPGRHVHAVTSTDSWAETVFAGHALHEYIPTVPLYVFGSHSVHNPASHVAVKPRVSDPHELSVTYLTCRYGLDVAVVYFIGSAGRVPCRVSSSTASEHDTSVHS